MADKAAGAQPIIKKIKKIAAGHHGGSWKVALADLMTTLMAFFLVTGALALLFNLLADIAYAALDPRIRVS